MLDYNPDKELIMELTKIAEALMQQIHDIRLEIGQLKRRKISKPIVTSLSEEIEQLQTGYHEAMSSPTMNQAINRILCDWRNRGGRY